MQFYQYLNYFFIFFSFFFKNIYLYIIKIFRINLQKKVRKKVEVRAGLELMTPSSPVFHSPSLPPHLLQGRREKYLLILECQYSNVA